MPPISRGALWSALAVCAAFFFAVFTILSLASDPLNHGDTHTDLRAILAAHQFDRVGAQNLHYLQTTDGGAQIGLEPAYYARHPGIGAVALAWFQHAGMSLGAARFLPLLASTIGVFCIFLFFRAATGNDWVGVIGAAVYASLAPVWLMADSYMLHSWSLAGKAVALWLIAAGSRATGNARFGFYAAAGVSAAACIVLGGLETMPSTGFLAFLLPLVLVRERGRSRVVAAFLCAALVGAGMAAGLGIRIWNMTSAFDGSLHRAWVNFSWSLKYRSSLNDASDRVLTLPYPVEIGRRVWIYAPHVFWLVAVALAASAVGRVRTGRWPRWPAVGVLVASFVGEGLYFIGMRNHATEHFHTLMLFTLTMAAAGTASLGVLVAMLPSIPAVIRGLGVVAVLVASIVFAPLRRPDYGNLHVPRKPDPGKPYFTEGENQARLLPPNSVVLVGSPGSEWLAYGAALGLQGHTMVCIGTFEHREWERVFDRAKASQRPVFAMIQRDSIPPETMAEIVRLGRVVSSGRFTTLHALTN